jgi:LysM repeat protein
VRPHADWRRYAAPVAFLLAVTIAVVAVRAGLEQGKPSATTATRARTTETTPKRAFWIVKAGDTFQVISQKTGVSVATIVRLNPNVSSTSLFIGQRIRLK